MVLNCTQCACSLLVSTWMIASKTVVRKYDNKWVSVGLHAWMNVFWIVNLGLTASLAKEWSPQCSTDEMADKICSTYVTKRDTTFKLYFGALVGSASLIGVQVYVSNSHNPSVRLTPSQLAVARHHSPTSPRPEAAPLHRLTGSRGRPSTALLRRLACHRGLLREAAQRVRHR
jgi:hypothetical protein